PRQCRPHSSDTHATVRDRAENNSKRRHWRCNPHAPCPMPARPDTAPKNATAPPALYFPRAGAVPRSSPAITNRKSKIGNLKLHHSHSIVLGGLLEMSQQTRLTPLTSLLMRAEMRASRS